MDEKGYNIFDYLGVNSKSPFEQKEIYKNFLEIVEDEHHIYHKAWSDRWKKLRANKNPYTITERVAVYLIPIMVLVALLLFAIYGNLTATIIFACCCSLPLLLGYTAWVIGTFLSGMVVYAMDKVKKENNLL